MGRIPLRRDEKRCRRCEQYRNIALFSHSQMYCDWCVVVKPSKQHMEPPKESQPKVPASGHVYLMKRGGLYKIGLSSKPLSRFDSITAESTEPLHFLHAIRVADMRRAESELHQKFSAYHDHLEWFNLPEDVVLEFLTWTNL